ncbi:MAG: hypothetical protein DMD70_12005 [Gemmatimonadetes bacterium]|nr:MAG: hypothetical protein DMD70_12005 [Gemmatimonadota bacterium]
MNDDATLHDDKLQEVARRLGARAAERLDVERTAQAVVARLRTEPRAEIRVLGWIRPAWLRIAAVLVLVVGAGVVVRSLGHDRPTTTALATAAGAELNDLSADQLRQLLEAVGQQPGGEEETVSAQDVSLEDLSALELRALLRSLEG